MRKKQIFLLLAAVIVVHNARGNSPRAVEVKSADGAVADAHYNLADAYLKNGQKDLARTYAEKALAMLDSHAAPLAVATTSKGYQTTVRNPTELSLSEATVRKLIDRRLLRSSKATRSIRIPREQIDEFARTTM
jgi:helix-turn-helix protein/tetratricopeptide repeat protein